MESTDRDALAKLIRVNGPISFAWPDGGPWKIADAIIAAGFTRSSAAKDEGWVAPIVQWQDIEDMALEWRTNMHRPGGAVDRSAICLAAVLNARGLIRLPPPIAANPENKP